MSLFWSTIIISSSCGIASCIGAYGGYYRAYKKYGMPKEFR